MPLVVLAPALTIPVLPVGLSRRRCGFAEGAQLGDDRAAQSQSLVLLLDFRIAGDDRLNVRSGVPGHDVPSGQQAAARRGGERSSIEALRLLSPRVEQDLATALREPGGEPRNRDHATRPASSTIVSICARPGPSHRTPQTATELPLEIKEEARLPTFVLPRRHPLSHSRPRRAVERCSFAVGQTEPVNVGVPRYEPPEGPATAVTPSPLGMQPLNWFPAMRR